MLLRSLIELVENGRIPDLLTRAGIRLLLLQRFESKRRRSRSGMASNDDVC